MKKRERFSDEQVSSEEELGSVAVFFDHENIVLGTKRGKPRFDPTRVIQHLSERGDVVVRRAYADWGRFDRDQRGYLEQGVEMVFMPSYGVGDKNRTDTAICVDAMDILRLQPDIDTYVIVSGDSDFGVVARRLRSNGRRVVGISARDAASKILVSVCQEFIFYESLCGDSLSGYDLKSARSAIVKTLPTLTEEYGDTFQSSILKERLRRMNSSFSERNYGCQSFTALLEKFPELFKVWKGGRNQVTVLSPSGNGKNGRGRKRGNADK
jgi:uncharacterized LabA/DUF88 family protein